MNNKEDIFKDNMDKYRNPEKYALLYDTIKRIFH